MNESRVSFRFQMVGLKRTGTHAANNSWARSTRSSSGNWFEGVTTGTDSWSASLIVSPVPSGLAIDGWASTATGSTELDPAAWREQVILSLLHHHRVALLVDHKFVSGLVMSNVPEFVLVVFLKVVLRVLSGTVLRAIFRASFLSLWICNSLG